MGPDLGAAHRLSGRGPRFSWLRLAAYGAWLLPASMMSRVRSCSSLSRARSFFALSNRGWYSASWAGVSLRVTVLPPILRVHFELASGHHWRTIGAVRGRAA